MIIIIYLWLMTWEVVPNLPSKWDMEATAYQYGWTLVGQCCLLRWRVLSQYSYSGKPENQGVCRIFLQTKKNFLSSLLWIEALPFILKWSLIKSWLLKIFFRKVFVKWWLKQLSYSYVSIPGNILSITIHYYLV